LLDDRADLVQLEGRSRDNQGIAARINRELSALPLSSCHDCRLNVARPGITQNEYFVSTGSWFKLSRLTTLMIPASSM